MGNLIYKSPLQTVTSLTGTLTFRDWVERTGPNGGRVVIDRLVLHCTAAYTVATATLPGEDVPRLFGALQVLMVDGTRRWNCGADAARIMAFHLLGADKVQEAADIAAGAATPQFALVIPLAKPYVHEPSDYAMPVDWFDKVTLTLQGTADAHPSGGTLSAFTSATYWVVAECHEELDVIIKCVDEVRVDDFNTVSQAQLSVGGKLHDLVLHSRGADGGASQATMTDARIDFMGLMPLTRQEFLQLYRYSRGVANNLASTQGGELRSDPMAASRAVPVITSDIDTSFFTGKTLKTCKIDLTSSVTNQRAISRVTVPASAQLRNLTSSLYDVKPGEFRVKTASKSRRSLAEWPATIRPFAPLKAPLKRLGA